MAVVLRILRTDNSRDIINERINDWWNWREITDKMTDNDSDDISKLDIEDIKLKKSMWERISKLSVNLWTDHDFYQKFAFRDPYVNKEYEDALVNIGFVREGDWLVNKSRPILEVVHRNVLTYCSYLSTFDQMILHESSRDNAENERRRPSTIEDTNSTKIDADVAIWDCSKCSFKNKAVDKCCEVCFNDREWKCVRCTFNNSSFVEECSACSFLKSSGMNSTSQSNESSECVHSKVSLDTSSCSYSDSVDADVTNRDADESDTLELPKMTWNCKNCIRKNEFNTYRCTFCQMFAPFFCKWICEKCSYYNDEFAERCEICSNSNVRLINCSDCKSRMFRRDNVDICRLCSAATRVELRKTKALVPGKKTEISKTKDILLHTCAMCKDPLKSVQYTICEKCSNKMYYCTNQWCGAINKIGSKHCRACKVKKNSNVTEFNTVKVHNGFRYIEMWQCTVCHAFNNKSSCTKCKNIRHNDSCKMCLWCRWVNSADKERCKSCSQALPS